MITLTNVTRRFGALTAVDDLSLEIRRGEVFGLLGPNGAGKSTTVNLIVGLLLPDRGDVAINGGGRPTDAAVRRQIGVAPQSLALYDELSGQENVRFFGQVQGLGGKDLDARTRAVLEFVDLYDRRRDRCGTYSGGMKRRLNLAAALVHDPTLLLFDEPTVGVDPQSRNAILEKIVELKRQGRTVVYTTHYMEEVERICDRVAIVDHGRLLALDTVDGLIAAHGGHNLVIAETAGGEQRFESDDPLADLTRLQNGGGLGRFRVERPNLESVFLKLTGRKLRE